MTGVHVLPLLLDPMQIPDSGLVQGLSAIDGSLNAYGPGHPDLLTLHQWRKQIRVQQVAFALTKALTEQWVRDRGDTIPTHRLFPQLLGYVQRFLTTKLECPDDRVAQDVAVNPYFHRARR